ncbi:hypothetical protein [Merismopedia glauca]|uniref:Uncharacterized protein n=1 Tax=Merismopedia glauca CCAP 1448/3 TaxID=1296344 RepID=A0A2T1C023_9CYAN|nr:hypothetical protein [Merismopedia glauca]PSB01554.1 hypothetical protein C7B64_17805 [Merismopedia glauca CCAP 1448/3]
MNQSLNPHIALKIQQQIRLAEDDLVIYIEEALDNSDYLKTGKEKLEESQFRNLVQVADTTESPEVVKNFLCYQVGRDKKWGTNKNSLAAKIIKDIDSRLKEKARKIADISDDIDFKPILMELIRRYLGYGYRYLKYLNAIQDKKIELIGTPRSK